MFAVLALSLYITLKDFSSVDSRCIQPILSLYITLGGGILAVYNPTYRVTLCTALSYVLHDVGFCSARR